jgi:hypothetical protein
LSEVGRVHAELTRAAARLDELHKVRTPDDRCERWLPREFDNYRVAGEQIQLARQAAAWPGYLAMLWRWGSGSDLETGWRSLHTADQALLEIQDEATVLARVPEIKAAVLANLPAEDTRRADYSAFLDKWTNKCAASPPPHKPEERPRVRERIRMIKRAADGCSDVAHSNLRNYRNWLLITGLVLLFALITVGFWHALHPNFFKICAADTTRRCMPTDILEIEAAGALGGLVAAVFALRRLDAYGGPYALPLWQALLRVPSGGAGALLGVFVMQAHVVTALSPQLDDKLIPYALVFGYTPDFVLRLLDEKVNKVGEAARTKNDPLRKAQPDT